MTSHRSTLLTAVTVAVGLLATHARAEAPPSTPSTPAPPAPTAEASPTGASPAVAPPAGTPSTEAPLGEAPPARGDNAVYLIDAKMVGMPQAAAATIVSVMAKAAADDGIEIFTREDANVLLAREASLQVLAADTDGLSLATLGQKVGARWVLAAVVSAVDGDTRIEARLIDVQNAQVASRRVALASDYDGAVAAAAAEVARLALSPLFLGKAASLTLKISEEGANVLVDDQQVATAPLEAPLTLPGGVHLVTVTREGFISYRKTFVVKGGEAFVDDVTLRPSKEWLEDYRFKNGALRVGAWTSTVVAVLAGAGTVGGYVLFDQQNQQSALIKDEAANLGDDVQVSEEDQARLQRELDASQNQAGLYGALTGAGATVLGVSAVAAVVLWVVGSDPGRYDDLAE